MLISIWLTNACNLRCRYCYEEKSDFVSMKEETAASIIEFIKYCHKEKKENNFIINFYGGEPLLKFQLLKSIVESLERVKKEISISCSYFMTTNGTLLTEKIVDYLKSKNFKLSLSLDGLPEIHNKNRITENGEGSFQIVSEKIPYLLKTIPDTFARLTYDHSSVYSLSKGIGFIADLGFKNIKPVLNYFDKLWSQEDAYTLQRELDKSLELLKGYSDASLIIPLENALRVKCGSCRGGISQFYISPDGNVYPCSYVVGDENYVLGNIKSGYESLRCVEHINKHYAFKYCKGCTYFNYCSGTRCIYLNYKATGSFDVPTAIMCAYEKYLYKASRR